MHKSRKITRIAVAFAAAIVLAATDAGPSVAAPADESAGGVRITRFLGEQRLPHRMLFGGTTVGGLSGLDRDPRTGAWYLISDDRWRYNAARFYTGELAIDPATGAFTGVSITGVTTLRRPDGSPYPAYGRPESADPETIRFDPRRRTLLWGHEGDRPDERNPGIPLSDLFIRRADTRGRHLGELAVPSNLHLTTTANGPRRNLGIEGLALAPRRIAAIAEGPRYEDGEPPAAGRGAPVRLTLWTRGGRPLGQYAYPVDPLPGTPVPPDGLADTGVSELLAVDDRRYLALERAWLEGVGYRVKVYQLDVRGATDILRRDSLVDGRPYRPVTKRLVLDVTSPAPAQNLEGLAWGPRLATGECTLVIASDDNFDAGEATQFLAYAVRGCPA